MVGVDPRVAADLEHDAGLREGLEAGERDVDFVVAERQEPERVLPGLIGRRVARELRVHVGRGDRGAGHGRARRVGDIAQNGSGGNLRVQRGGRQQRRDDAAMLANPFEFIGSSYRLAAVFNSRI